MKHKGTLLYLSKRVDAASTRYRIFQFIPILEKNGWKCDYIAVNNQSFLQRLKLAFLCKRYSIIIIQRKLFDPLTVKLLTAFNSNIVFDYDDAIFLNDDGSSSPRRLKRFENITATAKATFAGNDYLAKHSKSKITKIIPTCIQFDNYLTKLNSREKTPNISEKQNLILVWIGSRSTKKYLDIHRPILEGIGKKHPNVILKIISDFSIEFEHLTTQCVQWTAKTEIDELLSSDIGIAPMNEDLWTRGKCALKIIQYMACGLPVISSNTGANAEIVQQNKTGFLVDTLDQWNNAISELKNSGLRSRMGIAAIERVKQNYTVEVQASVMDELFSQLIKNQ